LSLTFFKKFLHFLSQFPQKQLFKCRLFKFFLPKHGYFLAWSDLNILFSLVVIELEKKFEGDEQKEALK
jgi:hypothetical protein